jgi:general secretion pathway protein G
VGKCEAVPSVQVGAEVERRCPEEALTAAEAEVGTGKDEAPIIVTAGENPTMRRTYAKAIRLIIAVLVVLLLGVVFETRISIRKAREQLLSDDLVTMRAAINQYAIDKNRRPRSLEDMFAAGYVKSLPDDPFTDSNTTWVIQRDQNGGIVGIHSGSNRIGNNGKPYSSW